MYPGYKKNLIACIILGALVGLSVYPGQLSVDATVMITQSYTSDYRDWHPPLYSFFYGMVQTIEEGPAIIVLFNIVSYFLLVFALSVILVRKSRALSCLFIVLSITPWAIHELHYVQKDVTIRNFVLSAILFAYLLRRKFSVVRLSGLVLSLFFATSGRSTVYIILVPVAMYLLPLHGRPIITRAVVVSISIGVGGGLLLLANSAVDYGLIQAKHTKQGHIKHWLKCTDIYALKIRNRHYGADFPVTRELERLYWTERGPRFGSQSVKACNSFIKENSLNKNRVWTSAIQDNKEEYLKHHLSTYWKYWNGDEYLPLRNTSARLWPERRDGTLPYDMDPSYEPLFPSLRQGYFSYLEYLLQKFQSTVALLAISIIATFMFVRAFLRGRLAAGVDSIFLLMGAAALTYSVPYIALTGIVEPRYMFPAKSLILLSIPFGLFLLQKKSGQSIEVSAR